jgi:hypothetical protein
MGIIPCRSENRWQPGARGGSYRHVAASRVIAGSQASSRPYDIVTLISPSDVTTCGHICHLAAKADSTANLLDRTGGL